jgi:hypothetical protein
VNFQNLLYAIIFIASGGLLTLLGRVLGLLGIFLSRITVSGDIPRRLRACTLAGQ